MSLKRGIWAFLIVPVVLHCSPRERDFEPGEEVGKGNDGGARGDGPKDPEEREGLGALGASCDEEGALACAGYAQRFQLRCTDGEWSNNGTCPGGFHCDTSEANRGLCQPIVAECEGKGGEPICDGKDLVECGADEVSVDVLERCSECRPEGCYCPEGTARSEGEEPCVSCQAGTFSATEDAESCTPCEPGTYSDAEGATSCTACDAGTYSDEGASSCAVCPVGMVSRSSNATECVRAQVATGNYHTCALLTDGKVRCWGFGASGRLGYGNTDTVGATNEPADAGDVNVGGLVTQIAVGDSHTCALLSDGRVRCWGLGLSGRLGYGSADDVGRLNAPADAGDVNVGGKVVQVTAGNLHTCALLDSGNVRCWGSGLNGRLGYGNTENVGETNTPAEAGDVNVGGKVVQVVAGSAHTCALLVGGDVRCWGSGSAGKLGYGNTEDVGATNEPADVGDVAVGSPVVQIAAGVSHTCALLTDGNVRCWGSGAYGRLGYGNTEDVSVPADVGDVNVGGRVVQIAAGDWHTCALLANGNVRCWGAGDDGRLGYGNTSMVGDDETPADAGDVNVGGTVTQIAVGQDHTCALLTNGNIRCWGKGTSGALGYGNTLRVGATDTPADAGDVPYF